IRYEQLSHFILGRRWRYHFGTDGRSDSHPKADEAHPGASEIQARAIRIAVQEHGLHESVFSMVCGSSNMIGEALVARGAQIGDGFTERMLVNVGQACHRPT